MTKSLPLVYVDGPHASVTSGTQTTYWAIVALLWLHVECLCPQQVHVKSKPLCKSLWEVFQSLRWSLVGIKWVDFPRELLCPLT